MVRDLSQKSFFVVVVVITTIVLVAVVIVVIHIMGIYIGLAFPPRDNLPRLFHYC